MRKSIVLAVILYLPAVSAAAQDMPVNFTDVSDALDFTHRSTEFGGNGLSGAAWFDFNNDGLIDLFIPNGKTMPNALFQNMDDGVFIDVATNAGVTNGEGNAAAVAADFNNDGWTDLFLTGDQGRGAGWFQAPVRFYKNNGDGTFDDVTELSTIVGPAAHRSASAADIDNDGLLDLFIAGNTTNRIQPNKLYLNKGGFIFEDISEGAGLHLTQSSCASMFSDYDNDGDQDLFIASCTTLVPLDVFRNNGDYTFSFQTVTAGFGTNALFMGICGADYDHDGNTDLFVTNYASTTALPHALYHNDGNGSFNDQAFFAGLTSLEFAFGCSFTDFDNDGWDDLFFTGALDTFCKPGTSGCFDFETIGDGRGNRGTMLFNRGDGTFANFSDQMPVDMRDLYTSGVAHADFDQNGFTDLLIVSEATPAQHGRPANTGHPILYQNDGNDNNFVTIRLRGTSSNRDAIGAKVAVHTVDFVQTKEVYAGSSHLTTESAWLNFGLGKTTEIEKVVVNWPSGFTDVWSNAGIIINQTNVLVEGGSPVATEDVADFPDRLVVHAAHPNPFSTSTTISFALPEPSLVSIELYDTIGRRVQILTHGMFSTGRHSVQIHPEGLTGGMYIYRLEAAGEEATGKLVLTR